MQEYVLIKLYSFSNCFYYINNDEHSPYKVKCLALSHHLKKEHGKMAIAYYAKFGGQIKNISMRQLGHLMTQVKFILLIADKRRRSEMGLLIFIYFYMFVQWVHHNNSNV